jgi:hypothetical protein
MIQLKIDEILPNFIKTMHTTKGENKDQKERPTIGPKNKNPQPSGQERGVEKIIYLTPSHHKKHLRKGEGSTP